MHQSAQPWWRLESTMLRLLAMVPVERFET